MPAQSKMSRPRITARELEKNAFALRKAGLSYRAIGERLGVTKATAHRSVARALAEIIELRDGDREKLREIEVARLDGILMRQWYQALRGDGPSVDRVLRIMQRRCTLLGLDAPAASSVEIHDKTKSLENLSSEELVRLAGAVLDAGAKASVEMEQRDTAPGADLAHTQDEVGSTPTPATSEEEGGDALQK